SRQGIPQLNRCPPVTLRLCQPPTGTLVKDVSGSHSPPEDVNHNKPPSSHIKDAFSRGKRRSYVKPRDALKILEGSNLQVAVERCTELKALVNSLLTISGGQPLP
ncbi:MAG: DUF4276 family protein, partial [Acidobacteria bacterium]|nr:DUF4276 family protein [Acidobacteriota bacterium]